MAPEIASCEGFGGRNWYFVILSLNSYGVWVGKKFKVLLFKLAKKLKPLSCTYVRGCECLKWGFLGFSWLGFSFRPWWLFHDQGSFFDLNTTFWRSRGFQRYGRTFSILLFWGSATTFWRSSLHFLRSRRFFYFRGHTLQNWGKLLRSRWLFLKIEIEPF